MGTHSMTMTQVGQWAQQIVGGALVLACTGLLVPATTNARWSEEIITIEGTAPPTHEGTLQPLPGGGYTGNGGGGIFSPSEDGGGGGGEEYNSAQCPHRPLCTSIEGELINNCGELNGAYSWTEHYEFDTDGDVVKSWVIMSCYIESSAGWIESWYDPGSGSTDPIEICTGLPGQAGTCFEP